VFAGTTTATLVLTLMRPRPVAFAALKYLTAAGGPEPAGSARFVFETLFVGSVQVEPLWQPDVTPVIVEADAGIV
jgi:hypothetical protein